LGAEVVLFVAAACPLVDWFSTGVDGFEGEAQSQPIVKIDA
jgi:hypothetical protein